MGNTIPTTYMNLPNPVPGVDPGPDYAQNQYNCNVFIDQHNHSAGSGQQITPSGLNINTNLPVNNNNVTLVKTVNFQAQGSSLPGSAPNLGCIYVGGNELYYNDEAGNVVQITLNGNVNAGAGSITGLSSPASASYSSGTFIFQSAVNTAANIDVESVILRLNTAGSPGLTLSPPNSLSGGSYSLVLPAIPGTTEVVTLDASGNFGTQTYNQIANNRTRPTGSTVAAGGVAISSSCGTYSLTNTSPSLVTNLSVTITTVGNPVMLLIQDDGSGNPSEIFATVGQGTYFFTRNGLTSFLTAIRIGAITSNVGIVPSSALAFIDTPTAGTYTYQLAVASAVSGGSININNSILVAYEL